MIERALNAEIKTEWTTGDAVYGQHTGLRRLDGRAWRARTAVTGTKDERLYASARIRINGPAETNERRLLARSWYRTSPSHVRSSIPERDPL